jgi:iron(III) transport system permease protein
MAQLTMTQPARVGVEESRLLRLWHALSWQNLLLVLIVGLLMYMALVPLLFLFWGALRSSPPGVAGTFTLNNFVRAYGDITLYSSIWNTIVYSLGTMIVAVSIGTLIAWVVERTNTPLRGLIYLLATVRIIIPMMLAVIGWIMLLSPRIGLINKVIQSIFGLADAPFDIYTLPGMMWVEGIDLVPQAFLLVSAAMRSMDRSLEDAASTSGSGVVRTFFRITVPLAAPGILAACLIIFLDAFQSIEVPTLIGLRGGIHVLSTEVYQAVEGIGADVPLASTYGLLFVALAAVGMFIYQQFTATSSRFVTVTGKGYRPSRIDLGRWKYMVSLICVGVLGLGIGLPLLILAFESFMPFYTMPTMEALQTATLNNYRFVASFPLTMTALKNSTILAIMAGALTASLTMVAAWLTVRRRTVATRLMDGILFLPISTPGIVLALGMMWIYLTLPIRIYGTLWILLIAYMTRFMPMSQRFTYTAIIQVHKELEEAAALCGGSWLRTLVRITLPLIWPGFMTAFVYVAVYAFREFSASILLSYSGTEVTAMAIYDLWSNGQTGPVAAFAVIILAVLSMIVLIARSVGTRFGVHA